jgi:hypothetical protein
MASGSSGAAPTHHGLVGSMFVVEAVEAAVLIVVAWSLRRTVGAAMSEVAALLEEVADSLVCVALAVEEARKDLSCHRQGSSERGVVRCAQISRAAFASSWPASASRALDRSREDVLDAPVLHRPVDRLLHVLIYCLSPDGDVEDAAAARRRVHEALVEVDAALQRRRDTSRCPGPACRGLGTRVAASVHPARKGRASAPPRAPVLVAVVDDLQISRLCPGRSL